MDFRRGVALFLAFVMLFALVSCGGRSPHDARETSESDAVSDITADSSVFVPTVLELVRDGVTEFAIVYPQGCDGSIIDIAMRLRDSFTQYTGANFIIKSDIRLDSSADVSEYFEILIGDTNRAETEEVLNTVSGGAQDYAVAVCSNKLVIAGNSVSATVNGVYYFINKVLSAAKLENGIFSVSSEQNYYYKGVYAVEGFNIFGNKANQYKIVIPENARFGVERFALRLKYLLSTRAGVNLEIVTDAASESECEILIGQTARTATSVGDFEYAIFANGKKVEVIADSLYCYEFLYDYCSNKFCSLVKDRDVISGELYRRSTVDDIKASKIETVLGKTGELRFMQFNILGEEGHHPFSLASRMVAAMAEELNPDIFAIEEYNTVAQKKSNYPLEESLAALGYGMVDGNKTTDGIHKPATPVFYKTDVFDLIYEDSYNPTGGHTGKWTTSCVLKRISDGKKIGIVNIHLDHYTTEAGDALRVVQIKEAIATASALQCRYSCDILMTGDFNSRMSGGAYQTLLQSGYVNARELAEVSDNDTTAWRDDPVYNENGGFLEHPREAAWDFVESAIDHTMHLGNGLNFNVFDVLTDTCSLSVSDHAATVIDFDLIGYAPAEPIEPWTDEYTKNY